MKHEIKKEVSYDGIIKEEYEYLTEEKLRDGWSKYYDCNGNLEEESFYKFGKKNGKSKEYYNGKLIAEGNYKEGKKEGLWIVKDNSWKEKKIIFIDGIEQKENKKNLINLLNFSKVSVLEIILTFTMVTIILTCIFQINLFMKDLSPNNPKKEYTKEKVLVFPERYEDKK